MATLFSPRESGSPDAQRYVWIDSSEYTEKIIRDSITNNPISDNPAVWSISFNKVLKDWRGINISLIVKNQSNQIQPAPYIRMPSCMYHKTWSAAGVDSNFRHILNYMSHDTYGMRPLQVTQGSNPAEDKFGNPDAIYGVNWFAPCLSVENWATGRHSWGFQMMSVSTDYLFPFKIYGDYDPVSLKGYFRIEGNVNVPNKGIIDRFAPGEERKWNIWLRFESYAANTLQGEGSAAYRKIAALRSYEPYFVSYWNLVGKPDHGPRVSGRVYGVDLAGPNAPKAYFAPRDNPRRYFLFSTENKTSLDGHLPLPAQDFMNPETVSGWKSLLDAVADVPTLKTYGYQAILLLHPAGWGNADQGGNPAIFTNLPLNLRNTIPQIKQWEITNGLRVFFAADNALKKVNTGEYNDLAESFDHTNSLQKQSISDNFNNGVLRSVGGTTLFNLPNDITEPWVNSYLKSWRTTFPPVTLVAKNRSATESYTYIVPSYIDRSEFLKADYSEGGRDWFLDLLLFGTDPWVYMPIKDWYADYGNGASTNTAYDNYALKVEKDHQVVVVTIGKIVRSSCLMPKKRNWKEVFNTFSAVEILGTLCSAGDPQLGGRTTCNSSDFHNNYSSNIPSNLRYDMKAYNAWDGFYDWTDGHSWFPGFGGAGDIANYGDALLWLWDDSKLTKGLATLVKNINGTDRPSGPYLSSDFNSYLFLSVEPWHSCGSLLSMFSAYQLTTLQPSTPGSGLPSRTLRDWWIWVMDQVQPGWSVGLSSSKQDDFLQKKWVERWTIWLENIISTIKTQRPLIKGVGAYGFTPSYGTWDIGGLDYGTTNPDDGTDKMYLEISYWSTFTSKLDFFGPSMYLWDYNCDFDAPLMYGETGRNASDPIQTIMFNLLTIRKELAISRYNSNKPVYPFIWNKHIRDGRFINSNIEKDIYTNKYFSGCHGTIWWAAVTTASQASAFASNMQTYWYGAASDINSRTVRDSLDITPPDTILDGAINESDIIPDPNQSSLAQFGKVKIVKINEGRKIDFIEGFGVERYSPTKSGAVGEIFPIDYSSYDLVAIANSIDGTLQISKALSKYNRVELDILDSTLNTVGMPHWVIEDTFEWVNSGMPSHLAQVHHSNVICGGISSERIYPGLQELTAPAYQSKYIVPCDTSWYDKLNSTVDYNIYTDSGNEDLSLPYPNAVLYISDLNQIWVGGYKGILTIDVDSKEISSFSIKSDRQLLIKDIKRYQNKIYILDEASLFIYDMISGETEIDVATGLPQKLHSVASVFGSNIIIGASDGVYARKSTSLTWKKVISTSKAVNLLYSPDAVFAVSDNGESYYSTDGFTWTRVGVINNQIVNKIQKHRSQILFATNQGLYQDGGSFYASNLSLQLLDIFDDAAESSDIIANDIDSDFNKAVIGLSDGRYLVYADGFVIQPVSKLSTIHKILIIGDDIWLFGYNEFRITSENFVRKLATGFKIS